MKLVYSLATEVIAWIGPASNTSSEAVNALRKKLPVADKSPVRASTIFNRDPCRPPFRPIAQRTTVSRECLEELFARPYWKRVWIIQEVAVASHVRIICGSEEITWHDLADAVGRAFHRNYNYRKPISELVERTASYTYVNEISAFRTLVRQREPIGLLKAMYMSKNTLSTDPHDKIFAFLGLSHDGHALVPLPNYDQPIAEILQDLTRQSIIVHRSLDFIFAAEFSSEPSPSDLPSWTPDVRINFLRKICSHNSRGIISHNFSKIPIERLWFLLIALVYIDLSST